MSTKIFNQKGFSALETILIAVVLAGIVGAGVYVWTSRQEAKTEAATVEVKKATFDLDKAEKNINDFYADYFKAFGDNDSVAVDRAKAAVKQYSTAEFYNKYLEPNGYDIVLCSQNSWKTIDIVSVKQNGEGAEADVDIKFDENTQSIKVEIDKNYKISNVVCPTN